MTTVDAQLELPGTGGHSAHTHSRPNSQRASVVNGAPPAASSTAAPTALAAKGDIEAMAVQYPDVEARCGGCKEVIDQENGGIVVAFGSSLWHVDCFRCAKCKGKVSADTNLLLLSDGNPVCGNCSYQCFVCKQAITEEAIMTGDESYHAHCFTCRTCKRRIDELVFAKTSQGIYCMACHNERVARSRRHVEAKLKRAARKEKEREEAEARKRTGLSTSSTSTSLNVLANAMTGSPASTSTERQGSTERGHSPRTSGSQPHSTSDKTMRAPSPIPHSVSPSGRKASLPNSPAVDQPMSRERSGDSRPPRSNTASPTPGPSTSPQNSMNGGVNHSPSNPNLAASGSRFNSNNRSPSTGVGLGVSGLGVPTSKAEKRRSINPGMNFNLDGANNAFASEPRAPSPLRSSFIEQQQTIPPPRSSSAAASPVPTTPTPAPTSTAPPPERVPSPAISPTMSKTPTPAPLSPALGGTPAALEVSPPKTESSKASVSDSSSPPPPPKTVDASPVPKAVDQSLTKEQAAAAANGETPLPKILPTMSFSLSDPDFAVLLKEMEASGQTPDGTKGFKKDLGLPHTPKARTDSEADSAASVASDSEADSGANASGLPRSSKTMNLLSSVANGESGVTSSPSRALLSPNDQASTPTLRRKASKESIMSVRIEPDSSFQAMVESVSTMTPGEDGKVSVDYLTLSEAIREHQQLKDTLATLKAKYTGARRSSQQYSDGLTVAGEEYDKEVARRNELEAEVIRLRAQVHGQTARLSVISSDERRAESMRRQSQDLASNLTGLERDISRLRAQRDISLAEVEELYSNRGDLNGSPEETTGHIGRSLTRRLDTIKEQYSSELGPLSAQREALQNEINELRDTREQLLEESAALAAKNDDLSELNASLTRATENMQDSLPVRRLPASVDKRVRGHPSGSPSMSSIATALHDVPEETKETARVIKVSKPEPIESAPVRRFKWMGKKNAQDAVGAMGAAVAAAAGGGAGKRTRPQTEVGLRDHQFQQHSTMRLGRCEMCNDKMWGLQEVKCAACGVICHSKCADKHPRSCPGQKAKDKEDDGPMAPSMFGRDLSDQAESDASAVPVIVTKCISAVEANGMEYEGIYRKTGGSSQSKQITQLFERGQYDRFDLEDLESFNDISSITSVLKTYFRQLPDPLLTHSLHESFVAAANIRDVGNKHAALCALLAELPDAHYNTLRVLMLHLHRVTAQSEVNLMTSQNLGVVFGPTLLRSADPNREFGDMAGKALSVQWMVENAPNVFAEERE